MSPEERDAASLQEGKNVLSIEMTVPPCPAGRGFLPVTVLCVFVLAFLLVSFPVAAKELSDTWGNLEGTWVYRCDPKDVGNEEGWARPELDDADWETIRVPGLWGRQDLASYDGIVWYRTRFAVPESWRGESLALALGRVDDEDQTYLNGERVGETGPGLTRAVLVYRNYAILEDLVRFGEENVLAIRVNDLGGPGGLVGPTLHLLPESRRDTMMTLPGDDRSFEERFETPPASCRILKIVHSPPDTEEGRRFLLQSLIAQGFGGMATNVAFNGYVEDEERWQDFTDFVSKAKEADMALWLYDERGYPSGTAGTIVLRDHPEWEARGLTVGDEVTEGEQVAVKLPPGDIKMASAFPVRDGCLDLHKGEDLSSSVKEGQLTWDPPQGTWHVVVITEGPLYEGTHAAVSLAEKNPYINLLMKEPTERFVEVTHEAYASHLGDDLSPWFISTFTDEPSLMSMFMRPQPWVLLPWSPELPQAFAKRHGAELEPLLPALFADCGPQTRKIRYDFWHVVGYLVSENYFGQIGQWCEAHGLRSGGHLLLEEPLLTHVPLYGDFFQCARKLTAPSIDCLTSIPENVPWFVARLFGSVADLEGRTFTMSETSDHCERYRPQGDERPVRVVTVDEIRGTCSKLILNGINTITSYYSFADLSSDELVQLNTEIGRCCTALRGGHQVTDIALLYPIESVWPAFVPSRNWTEDCPEAAQQTARIYRDAMEALYRGGRDFTMVDGRALEEARVENGVLVHGSLRWRVLVLPCVDTLSSDAWERIEQFWREGGVVISLGRLPANTEDAFPSAEVKAFAEKAFGKEVSCVWTGHDSGGASLFLEEEAVPLLGDFLDLLIERDVETADKETPIRATHRRIDGKEVYFLLNDSREAWAGEVRFCAQGKKQEQWDPATGKKDVLPYLGSLYLGLDPFAGMVFRFEEAKLPEVRSVDGAHSASLVDRDLPEPTHRVGKGTHVALEGEVVSKELPAGGNSLTCTARLTKSEVDTHCFLILDYPSSVDLSRASCLSVERWVPEGQDSRAHFYVILRDAQGVEYIADTGTLMSQSGQKRCVIPMVRFHRAGWSETSDNEFDLSQITSISLGWGGYLGKEGEKISFSVSPPVKIEFDVP